MVQLRFLPVAAALVAACAFAQPDPAFLRRELGWIRPVQSDVTTATCAYHPVFGAGDRDARVLVGVVRFGEMVIEPGGSSAIVMYPDEEQVYLVLEGSGSLQYGKTSAPLGRNDYAYIPPGVSHGFANGTKRACRVLIAGYRVTERGGVMAPEQLLRANIDEVPKQVVGGHPPSTLYQLLMGDVTSKRDKIAAARVLTSMFVMEFAPGGTNIPHSHKDEEEIYLVLNGHGDMVAGTDQDGKELRHPAKAGGAYFFRPGCRVGFYTGTAAAEEKTHILAFRSLLPH